MFFKSIRFKVILWYTLLLTITLFIFSFILYEGFRKTLYDDFDDLLSSRAEGVANSIDTFWHAKGRTLAHAADMDSFVTIARTWVEEQRKDPELMTVFVQILDLHGERIVSSKVMPSITQLSKEDFNDILDGEDSFDTVGGALPAGKKVKFRMYSKPVLEEGKVTYVVQVAGPLDLLMVALKNLILMLFLLLPLTVILAAAPGVFLVRLTLKPVDTMVKTLRQITAENLKLKIHIPDTKDEIRRLADTFNEMIERLDRSFSSQQRFIQDVSHELKTPLAILKGEIESIISKIQPFDKNKAALQKMLMEINILYRIIEHLLTITTFENEQMVLEIKKIDLTALVEQVVNGAKTLADQKDIDTSFYCDRTITLDGDENQLSRLFMNLIDNAIKYTHRKGRITVTAHRDGEFAKIAVSDTGVGMPENEIPYIFDRFYQIVKSRNPSNGFGIGLSIVKSVVEAHKGTISVTSQRGQGSTFAVSLPLSYLG